VVGAAAGGLVDLLVVKTVDLVLCIFKFRQQILQHSLVG
jgi:hypothetical protein